MGQVARAAAESKVLLAVHLYRRRSVSGVELGEHRRPRDVAALLGVAGDNALVRVRKLEPARAVRREGRKRVPSALFVRAH